MQSEQDPQSEQHRAGNGIQQEAADLLASLLQNNPLPMPAHTEPEGIYPLTSPLAQKLTCVAVIRDGMIYPIVDLEETPVARTPGEKMHLFALTAKTILEGLMDALLFWEERRRQRENPGDDDGGCRV